MERSAVLTLTRLAIYTETSQIGRNKFSEEVFLTQNAGFRAKIITLECYETPLHEPRQHKHISLIAVYLKHIGVLRHN